MLIKQLSEKEFESTFTPPMFNITTTAEEVLNIWEYVEKVLSSEYSNIDTDSWDVEYVYSNQPKTYQHILINTGMQNIYLVVVVDIPNKSIYGHRLLNLNQKYVLTQ